MSKSDLKFKVHCKIIDYVEQKNPRLAQIIRAVCADNALTSLKGKPGITFLMPQDSKEIDKLADLATSVKLEDVDRANDMINALIIRDVFKNPSDWMAHRDDIPNSLYPYQHVEVDSVTDREVIFKSGARAELDKDFIDGSKKKQLAVWKLTKGEIPVTKDKPATGKYSKKHGSGPKVGGYIPTTELRNSLRWKIGICVENKYCADRMAGNNPFNNGNSSDVYRYAVLSLVDCIRRSRGDEYMINRVLPFISFSPIDFYFLVEPHRMGGYFVLDDDIIADWWQGMCDGCKCDCNEVTAYLDGLFKKAASVSRADVYTNPAMLLKCISDASTPVLNIQNPKRIVSEISVLYTKLEQSNSIGECTNVYPEFVAQYYKNEPGLKMTHDELRFVAHGAFEALKRGSFDAGKFNTFVNYIGDNLNADTVELRNACRTLLLNSLPAMIDAQDKVNNIRTFVASTCFLQVPILSAINQKNTTIRPDAYNLVLFNIAKASREEHDRIFCDKKQLGDVVGNTLPTNIANID